MSLRLTLQPDGASAEVAQGEVGVDLIDAHERIAVPLSCRDARCGSCLVRVVHGSEFLARPGDRERDTLRRLGSDPTHRLCCSIVITSDTGSVTIERVSPPHPGPGAAALPARKSTPG